MSAPTASYADVIGGAARLASENDLADPDYFLGLAAYAIEFGRSPMGSTVTEVANVVAKRDSSEEYHRALNDLVGALDDEAAERSELDESDDEESPAYTPTEAEARRAWALSEVAWLVPGGSPTAAPSLFTRPRTPEQIRLAEWLLADDAKKLDAPGLPSAAGAHSPGTGSLKVPEQRTGDEETHCNVGNDLGAQCARPFGHGGPHRMV